MIEGNYPCAKCGHKKDDHDDWKLPPGEEYCLRCLNRGRSDDMCFHVFKQDNLKYLESLYEAKHK